MGSAVTVVHQDDAPGQDVVKLRFVNALQSGDIEEIKGILEQTPELIYATDENEVSALIASCTTCHNYEIAHLLIEKGAHVDHSDKHGNTALMGASQKGYLAVAQLLLDKGASVDSKNQSGATALIIASSEGHESIVELLLNHGADVNAVNNFWHSALTAACSQGHASIAELLLNKGANINQRNKKGDTALILASFSKHIHVVKLLLNRGADIDIQDESGITALCWACQGGHIDIVKILLENGADASIKTVYGKTALEHSYKYDIRQLLLCTSESKCASMIKYHDVVISDCISSSAFSDVHRGQYRGTDVAIKMLRGMRTSSADLLNREIEILSKLRHPRIVSLLGVILNLPRGYSSVGLVTEFMPRGSLYDVLHLNTTPPEHRLSTLSSKLRVLRDVADGMRFLHMSNVIHRDLKSPNVLLDEDGRAKICDFGLSKILPPNISHTTAAVGTPAWSSPESLLEETDTVRQSSDVYSFGVILWEMLTNSIPWNNVTPFQIAVRLSIGETLPIDAVASVSDTPFELVAMLEYCLARNPDDRPTFEHIVQFLSDVLPACIEREGRVPCHNAYLCPISYEIMEDPVICSDGHTYDRVNIERWLQDNDTSPITNKILVDKTLRPNIALRGMILDFIVSYADAV